MKTRIIFVLMCFYKSLAQEYGVCSTPIGKRGICKSILDCPFLKGLAAKYKMSKQEVYHLRRSSCGFKNSIPMVCCPEYDAESCAPSEKPPDSWTGCCGRAYTRRYKKGTTFPEIDQYPWMALIEYENNNKTQLLCSATLISSRYLISTAACVYSKNEALKPRRVRLGEYDITNDGPDCVGSPKGDVDCNDGAISVPIERIVMHPAFHRILKVNDISLIRLSKMVPYTDFIRPICLPTVDITTNPPKHLRMYVTGWGSTESAWKSDILRHVGIPLVAQDICQKTYSGRINILNGHVCAGATGRDACKGDTGAPLMYDTGLFEEVIGLVSFGPIHCGQPNSPGVYTKIYAYEAWIRGIIEP